MQKRLGLPIELALALFADINTEARVKADRPQQSIPSLYENLFLNPRSCTRGSGVRVPIAAGKHLEMPIRADHRGTVLAAFALSAADLERLQAKLADDDLSIAKNSPTVARYATLAQTLKLSVKDLLTFETLSGVADIFATPRATLDFIDSLDWATRASFTADDLDYLLRANPDSPLGLRDEAIAQDLESLREAVRSAPAANAAGVVASHVATSYGIRADQASTLLTETIHNGSTLSQGPRIRTYWNRTPTARSCGR